MKPLAVVLLSGGMDSCVTLALVREAGYDVAALHVNYGQRTQQRELQAFNDICNHYAIQRRLVCDISHLAAIGGSSLTDAALDVEPANLERPDVPLTYVPFRNANILAIATSWAEVQGASAIAIGAVEEDSSGYPDCRATFFQAFQAVIQAGTRPETHIAVLTPVIAFSKGRIVTEGQRLKAPLEKTWSCYQGHREACGQCDSCALRLRGFREAGLEDPITYAQ
jgi:7-cyano-7-deazaguanine synthase